MKRLLYLYSFALLMMLLPVRAFALTTTDVSQYNYALYTTDMQAMAGRQIVMTLSMKNAELITGYQADILLPEGFSIATLLDENGDERSQVTLLRTLTNRHSLSVSRQEDGSYRFLSTSSSNKNYGGYDGSVAYITINVDRNVTDGEYPLVIKNQEMSEVTNVAHKVAKTEAVITIVSSQVVLDTPELDVEITDLTGKNDIIYTSPIRVYSGKQAAIDIMMRNTDEISGIQTDILLPTGFTLAKSQSNKGNILFGDRTDASRHAFNIAQQTDGAYRLVGYSAGNKTFAGNDGIIATILFDVADNILPGEYKAIIRNSELAKVNNTRVKPEKITSRAKVELPGYTYDMMHLGSYTLYTDNVGTNAGNQITLAIGMLNLKNICGFQADLVLPEGVTVATAKDEFGDEGPAISLGDRTSSANHSINCVRQADGSYRILCASTNNSVISGTIGTVFNITLDVASTVKSKNYPIYFLNQEFGEANNSTHKASGPYVSRLYVRNITPKAGDAVSDNKLDVKDVEATKEMLLHSDSKEYDQEAAEGEDGHLSIMDVTRLVKDLNK